MDQDLIDEALDIVKGEGRASTSLLQRKLRIGYAKAAHILDILEEHGAIGPANGSKPREVIPQWFEDGGKIVMAVIPDEVKPTEPVMDEVTREGELTPKQRLFCELYASDREFFGNGVQSYLEAYNPPRKGQFWYEAACSSASALLTLPKVFNHINNLLEVGGLNDAAVDKQLLFIIAQHDDKRSKVAAIREYNVLKKRIQQKIDLTSGGKPLVSNTIVFTDFAKEQEAIIGHWAVETPELIHVEESVDKLIEELIDETTGQ